MQRGRDLPPLNHLPPVWASVQGMKGPVAPHGLRSPVFSCPAPYRPPGNTGSFRGWRSGLGRGPLGNSVGSGWGGRSDWFWRQGSGGVHRSRARVSQGGWPQARPFQPALLRFAALREGWPWACDSGQDPGPCSRLPRQGQCEDPTGPHGCHFQREAGSAPCARPALGEAHGGPLSRVPQTPKTWSPAHSGCSADPSFSQGTGDPVPWLTPPSVTLLELPLQSGAVGALLPLACRPWAVRPWATPPLSAGILCANRARSVLILKAPSEDTGTAEPGPSSRGQQGTGL